MEKAEVVAERIQSLPRLERLAFLLRYADGISITETAKVLGIRREEAFEHLWKARHEAKNAMGSGTSAAVDRTTAL